MADKLFIPILLGTMRQGRESEKVAQWVLEKVQAHPEIETELIDPRNLVLPNDDDGKNIAALNPSYQATMAKADGLIIVSPEYNHSYPGTLKRVLDMIVDEYRNKPVGVVGVSDGDFAGVRMIEALLPVLRTLGMVALSSDMKFPNADELFEKAGDTWQIKNSSFDDRAAKFLSKMVWMTKALKWGRENLK